MQDDSTNSSETNTRNRGDDTTRSTPRRRVLAGSVSALSALALGSSAISPAGAADDTGRFNDAPGRGGEAIVRPADFDGDRAFEITRRTGDSADEIEGVTFQCSGRGNRIFLVGWYFEYEDGVERTLYTRSNNINTDVVYNWRPLGRGAKRCEVTDFIQTPFRATGPQR